MKYEYNGHLTEEERLNRVAKEIITNYPEINQINAQIIASLEDPITTSFDYSIAFKRLYNILFVMQSKHQLFKKVYQDIIYIYNSYLLNNTSSIIDSIMNELIRYVQKDRLTFPTISEFY